MGGEQRSGEKTPKKQKQTNIKKKQKKQKK